MLSLMKYRYVFVAVGLIGVVGFSVPSAVMVVRLPGGERFSELYVLGPGHMAEAYPFNVSVGNDYLVYLGVGNHLGNAAYYEVRLKLRNSTDALPNATSGVASTLTVLYRYEVFLADEQTWEDALNFSFSNVAFGANVSSVGIMRINDAVANVDKSAAWDNVNGGYFYQLIAELWLYNATSNGFSFHDRYVALWFNMMSAV